MPWNNRKQSGSGSTTHKITSRNLPVLPFDWPFWASHISIPNKYVFSNTLQNHNQKQALKTACLDKKGL
jgi:hypothetical protein